MKKLMSIMLAVMMAVTLMSTAMAAEADNSLPQPEGGKKFEGNWALSGGLIQINYEEEGYRVCVDLRNNEQQTGTIWEYSCFYQEDLDALDALTLVKRNYTIDPVSGDEVSGDIEQEGFVEENKRVLFTIDENGRLIWQDGIENTGADLEFINIGCFEGVWLNDELDVSAEIVWQGLNEETFYYTVFVQRGHDADSKVANLIGRLDPETGKLECVDADRTDSTIIDAGNESKGTLDAVFSAPGNGTLIFETDGGIELRYEFLGSNG